MKKKNLTVDAVRKREGLIYSEFKEFNPNPTFQNLIILVAMAALSSTTTCRAPPFPSSFAKFQNPNFSPALFTKSNRWNNLSFSTRKRRNLVVGSVAEDQKVVPLKENQSKEQESRLLDDGSEDYNDFSSSLAPSSSSSSSSEKGEDDDFERFTSRAINAAIVLGFGTFAVTKLLTIDHDYWHVSDLSYIYSIRLIFGYVGNSENLIRIFDNFVKFC